jgi:hypothetical protein
MTPEFMPNPEPETEPGEALPAQRVPFGAVNPANTDGGRFELPTPSSGIHAFQAGAVGWLCAHCGESRSDTAHAPRTVGGGNARDARGNGTQAGTPRTEDAPAGIANCGCNVAGPYGPLAFCPVHQGDTVSAANTKTLHPEPARTGEPLRALLVYVRQGAFSTLNRDFARLLRDGADEAESARADIERLTAERGRLRGELAEARRLHDGAHALLGRAYMERDTAVEALERFAKERAELRRWCGYALSAYPADTPDHEQLVCFEYHSWVSDTLLGARDYTGRRAARAAKPEVPRG